MSYISHFTSRKGQARLSCFGSCGGQVMIEAMVGITIAVVALLGILMLLTRSLGINKDIGQKLTATYLAAEGIEITRGLVDTNYAEDRAWNRGLLGGSYEFEYDTIPNPGGQPPGTRIGGDPTMRSSRELYFSFSTGLYTYDNSGEQTSFLRTIQIREDPSGFGNGVELGIISIVEWTKRGGDTKEVILEDHFFDWR